VNDADIPNLIILDLTKELKDFRLIFDNVELPTADIAATLSQIFETISIAEEEVFSEMLRNVAIDMGRGEGLYENARLDDVEQDYIIAAVINLGNKIKNNILALNGYRDGFFQYSFKEMLGENTVVLQKFNEELL